MKDTNTFMVMTINRYFLPEFTVFFTIFMLMIRVDVLIFVQVYRLHKEYKWTEISTKVCLIFYVPL
jgi:hypothetical protein